MRPKQLPHGFDSLKRHNCAAHNLMYNNVEPRIYADVS